MPAFGNIVIYDAAATPVAHTFAPVAINGVVASYADRSGGIIVGYPKLTLSLTEPSKNSRNSKARFKLMLPVLEVIAGTTVGGITPPASKAYELMADITFTIPDRATLQNRKDLLELFKNLLDHTTIESMVQDGAGIY